MNARPSLVLLFGFCGNLFTEKLLWGLFVDFRQRMHGIPRNLKVLGIDLQEIAAEQLPNFIDQRADAGKVNRSLTGWNEFVKTFTYRNIGGEHRRPDSAKFGRLCQEVRRWMAEHQDGQVQIYFALPHTAMPPTLKLFADAGMDFRSYADQTSLLLEKPSAIDLETLQTTKRLSTRIGMKLDRVRQIEHWRFKPGFNQMIHVLYGNTTLNEAFHRPFVKRIILRVSEMIGSNGREYHGVGVDSFLNHMMFFFGLALGNPLDEGPERVNNMITHRLARHVFDPNPEQTEEENLRLEQELYQRINARGCYGVCHEDRGGSDQAIPTAMIVQLVAQSNRLFGTPVVLIHQKNGPTKTTQLEVDFQKGDRWEYVADGYSCFGTREWRFSQYLQGLRPEGHGSLPFVLSGGESIPPEHQDGYPALVTAFLDGKLDLFMPLEFQEIGIRIVMPWLQQLDATSRDERVWFHRGSDAFRGFDWSKGQQLWLPRAA
ncbi:MAG: hypothetical protein KDD69_11380 [Bdellovibrionales bacterium]|nr:hypothetical protein [Bdellovibrionales bacterium]